MATKKRTRADRKKLAVKRDIEKQKKVRVYLSDECAQYLLFLRQLKQFTHKGTAEILTSCLKTVALTISDQIKAEKAAKEESEKIDDHIKAEKDYYDGEQDDANTSE